MRPPLARRRCVWVNQSTASKGRPDGCLHKPLPMRPSPALPLICACSRPRRAAVCWPRKRLPLCATETGPVVPCSHVILPRTLRFRRAASNAVLRKAATALSAHRPCLRDDRRRTLAPMSLKGKTLFITGGSRGIGLAIARRAAADGANIAIAAKTVDPHPRLEATLHTAAAGIAKTGGRAVPFAVGLAVSTPG